MSVPSLGKPEAHESQATGFYGRSFPRASVLLDSNNAVKQDRKMPPPSSNAPLLEWASKAGWNKGGAHRSDSGPKPPKQPFTPLFAFLAAQQLKLKKLHPFLGSSDIQALAKSTIEQDWDKLSAESQEMYVKLAEDDAQRYELESAEFERKHPGLLASRREHKRGVKQAARPRPPLKAFRIFAAEQIREKLGDGSGKPHATFVEEQKKLVTELGQVWKDMSQEEKAPFEEQAEGDLRRWERELEKFPELKAKVTSTAEARAAEAKQKAEKREILRAAKGKKARPARKRALPRPSPIVKNGALVRESKKNANVEGGGRAKRQRKAQKAAIVEEESEEDTDEEEEEEPDLGQSDSGDEIPSEDEEPEEEEAEEEDDEEAEMEADQGDALDADDADVEISDDEEAPAVAATPHVATPHTATHAVEALAAIAAEEEEEEAEDALRTLQAATEPKSSAGKNNIFGWATAALMSGFKGVWSSRKSLGTSSPLARPQLSTDPEGGIHVGITFEKKFDGEFFSGKVDKWLPENRWYAVSYEDGDSEELTEAELERLIKATEKRAAAGPKARVQKRKR